MTEFEARQIVIAHEGLWKALQNWGQSRNLELVRIPGRVDEDGNPTLDPGDDLPCYSFMPKDM